MYVDYSEWTTDRLKDEFFLALVNAPDNKYYDEAKILMYKIPLTSQYPQSELEAIPFFINFADLSLRVQSEFEKFCIINNKMRIGLFLKEVVIRLFENLDYEYTHMSVMRKLRIKMVKS